MIQAIVPELIHNPQHLPALSNISLRTTAYYRNFHGATVKGWGMERKPQTHQSADPALQPHLAENSHSTALRGGGCHRSTKASRGGDLDIEESVACWDGASFHWHVTLTRMLGSTLIRNEIVQVGEPRQRRLCHRWDAGLRHHKRRCGGLQSRHEHVDITRSDAYAPHPANGLFGRRKGVHTRGRPGWNGLSVHCRGL